MLAAVTGPLAGHILERRIARSSHSTMQLQPSESLQEAHPFFSGEMGHHCWSCESCPNCQTPSPSPPDRLSLGARLLRLGVSQQLLPPQYNHDLLLLLLVLLSTANNQQQVFELDNNPRPTLSFFPSLSTAALVIGSSQKARWVLLPGGRGKRSCQEGRRWGCALQPGRWNCWGWVPKILVQTL